MGRQGKRHKQLLNDLTEKRKYLILKEKALEHTVRRTWSGRGYGPVIQQTI